MLGLKMNSRYKKVTLRKMIDNGINHLRWTSCNDKNKLIDLFFTARGTCGIICSCAKITSLTWSLPSWFEWNSALLSWAAKYLGPFINARTASCSRSQGGILRIIGWEFRLNITIHLWSTGEYASHFMRYHIFFYTQAKVDQVKHLWFPKVLQQDGACLLIGENIQEAPFSLCFISGVSIYFLHYLDLSDK